MVTGVVRIRQGAGRRRCHIPSAAAAAAPLQQQIRAPSARAHVDAHLDQHTCHYTKVSHPFPSTFSSLISVFFLTIFVFYSLATTYCWTVMRCSLCNVQGFLPGDLFVVQQHSALTQTDTVTLSGLWSRHHIKQPRHQPSRLQYHVYQWYVFKMSMNWSSIYCLC